MATPSMTFLSCGCVTVTYSDVGDTRYIRSIDNGVTWMPEATIEHTHPRESWWRRLVRLVTARFAR